MTEEDALWQAIGAAPEDQLPRLVAADWYDERAGMVDCGRCGPPRMFPPYQWVCPTCNGIGRVSNGHAETAAALRATADRVPWVKVFKLGFGWWCRRPYHDDHHDDPTHLIERPLMDEMNDSNERCDRGDSVRFDKRDGVSGGVILFPSAAAAIRNLCRAWVDSRSKQGVPT